MKHEQNDEQTQGSRLPRLLGLVELLRTGQERNAQELAVCLNVSRRTIFRDLKTLLSAGVPVEFNASVQCYRLIRPAASLARGGVPDALSMALLLRRANTRRMLQAAALFETEITSRFPTALREEVSIALDWIVPERPDPEIVEHHTTLKTLFTCFHQLRKARVSYCTTHGVTNQTLLCPNQLVLRDDPQNTPTIVGYSSFHRENIGILVPRILSVVATEDTFEPTCRQIVSWNQL